jgi:hypothetical protein
LLQRLLERHDPSLTLWIVRDGAHEHVDAAAGSLISHGPNQLDQFPKVAGYVDRILKGEKPGNLPVQVPTKFTIRGSRTVPPSISGTPQRRPWGRQCGDATSSA